MQYKRVIVKLGTNLITGGGDELDRALLARLAEQIAEVREGGSQVMLVSSGSIASGRAVLGDRRIALEGRRTVLRRQALSALGQPHLIVAYSELFDKHGIKVAQALISREDLQRRLGYLNSRDTLNGLLKMDVLPIVNENDVVSTREIVGKVYGDNDRLAAMLANAIDSDLLILLGEMEGLYDRDPHHAPDAKLIPRVERITPELEAAARGPHDGRGSGGMASKIKAARLATSSGAAMVIASGNIPRVIPRICGGEELGTRFLPQLSHAEARKRWMVTGFADGCGGVAVDDGAVAALRKRGVSLLPAGITAVEGEFERGDIISVSDASGNVIALGLTNYSAADLAAVKGIRSSDMEAVLHHFYGAEAIHRNNLTMV